MEHKIYVSRERKNLGFPAAFKAVRSAGRAALRAQAADRACEISVLFTNDAGIQRLNRDFRGIDRPTDVLSFPALELAPGEFTVSEQDVDPTTGRVFLGDIALSLERCAEQAVQYGHPFDREIKYLIAHSVLHLLGYDHEDEAEGKRKMRSQEKEIMKASEEKE